MAGNPLKCPDLSLSLRLPYPTLWKQPQYSEAYWAVVNTVHTLNARWDRCLRVYQVLLMMSGLYERFVPSQLLYVNRLLSQNYHFPEGLKSRYCRQWENDYGWNLRLLSTGLRTFLLLAWWSKFLLFFKSLFTLLLTVQLGKLFFSLDMDAADRVLYIARE